MSKLKQLIGLQASNLSVRARALDLSIGAVSKYFRAVRAAGIGPADAEGLSEAELELRVFGPTTPTKANALAAPDCMWIHNEFKRHRHVTLQLLWEHVRSGCQRAHCRPILERLVHQSHRIELKVPGEAMRKSRPSADA